MIQLEVALGAHPLVSDGPYTHARVSQCVLGIPEKQAHIYVQYGTMDGDTFVPGELTQSKPPRFSLHGQGWDDFVAANKEVCTQLNDALHRWVLSRANLDGSVVEGR